MVSALDSRSSGPGSSSGRGHCVLGQTLYSHSASLSSQVQVKFIIKSTKFYKNNANPQIAEANLGG